MKGLMIGWSEAMNIENMGGSGWTGGTGLWTTKLVRIPKVFETTKLQFSH